MAYLSEFDNKCGEPGCSSGAKVKLLDWRNERRGKYCRRHGKSRLSDRQKYEDENPTHRQ